MLPANQIRAICAALTTAAVLLAATLAACGTVDSLRGKSDPVSAEATPEDATGRTVQIAWTSARASYCGFIFDSNQLRANYLASEMAAGKTSSGMAKLERAYDYTRESVTETIGDNLAYCNKERTAAIRNDLNRYLAGDYTPTARMGR